MLHYSNFFIPIQCVAPLILQAIHRPTFAMLVQADEVAQGCAARADHQALLEDKERPYYQRQFAVTA